MPMWGEWKPNGITLDLSSNALPTQTNKFRVTAKLPDYKLKFEQIQMEFEIALHNPCNTANKVVFADDE